MRTKFANLLKSALLIGAVMCCFSSCTYIPHNELDGKILTDENGKKYKLEWQSGYGESWRFLEQVKDATGKDTATRWKYVSKKQHIMCKCTRPKIIIQRPKPIKPIKPK